ncbi:MAG: FHA domain-containing protein, partial [Candidatus Binataceae bacterium]
GYGYQNRSIGEQPYAYGPGTWGQRAGYMNQEGYGGEGGYQRPCPLGGYGRGYGEGEGDDGGYGGGYGQPMGGYGYGGQQYEGNYGMLGGMLPMLGNYMR